MGMQTKIDWQKARKDYVSDTSLTYQDIADRYNCSLKAVKKVGSRDSWREGREAIIQRANEKVQENVADQLAEVNERHTNTYKNMQALGLSQLNIALTEVRRLQKEADDQGVPLSINKDGIIGQQRLKFLGDFLKVAMDGERITLGLPTSVSVSKTELAGKDGDALFEQIDTDDLDRHINKAIAALRQGDADGDSA
jgi:hypothetical protein